MSFPDRLAALREECGITQQQMADKIDLHDVKRWQQSASTDLKVAAR
ncbi:MAG TPA: helix-turn-helix transcriptional regulator [Burkholderiaceae bacterium]|nr:helix-turn-helix transcriptional regulator [Burkholderiaceae bacterium]